ncbi:MAG: hypothetical protein AAF223_04465, partial [Bacteroidota bacterium]
ALIRLTELAGPFDLTIAGPSTIIPHLLPKGLLQLLSAPSLSVSEDADGKSSCLLCSATALRL